MPRRTKQDALATRDAIIDAAETLFEGGGVARTSLDAVARQANVTRGAIYWHFRDKADLLNAMQDRARLPQEQFFESRGLHLDGSGLDALREATTEMIRGFVGDERARRVYTIILFRCEYVGDLGAVLLRRCEADGRMRAAILAVFERARRDGQLAAHWTPTVAADVYLAAIVGLFSEWLRRDGDFDVIAAAMAMMSSLFAGFRDASPVSA